MSSLDVLTSGTKHDLLQLIKQAGDVSVSEAMSATGLARTTLREHLLQLERDGLVRSYAQKGAGRGRPSHRYELTDEGDELFPRRDGVLLRELLGFLAERGEADLVEEFFEAFWADRTREVKRRLAEAADDPAARLEVLAEVLRDQGFVPEIEHGEDELLVRECNCPFPEAVKQTRLPCRLEAAFYEAIFDDRIRRVSYIPDGHPACTYAFPPLEET